jgi:hypothetical protein
MIEGDLITIEMMFESFISLRNELLFAASKKNTIAWDLFIRLQYQFSTTLSLGPAILAYVLTRENNSNFVRRKIEILSQFLPDEENRSFDSEDIYKEKEFLRKEFQNFMASIGFENQLQCDITNEFDHWLENGPDNFTLNSNGKNMTLKNIGLFNHLH